MSLQFVVRRADGVVILDLLGKATIGGSNDRLSEQLRQLIDEGTTKLLVNLSDLTQVDSSSISTIVRALVSLKTRGGTLKLLRPRGNVKLALETLHLLDAIPSAEDESQVIASFS